MENKRAQWGSKLGFILAAAGSAIGLGNIWKFPGKAFEGGGGAFLLMYLLIVPLLGMPVMLSELSVGRASQSNVVDAFKKLGHKGYSWVGWMGWTVAFIITCYYSHVGGWVLRYVASYVVEPRRVYGDPLGYFYGMLGYDPAADATFMPWTVILFAFLFLAICAVVIIKGVEGGIEKFNKVGMPALFVILVILFVRAATLPGAGEGIRYMLSLDWGKVTPQTFLIALSQAFYSLSLGMSIMVTYGSYLPKEENIGKNTFLVCTMDTLVAVLAGFIVVPAVFATLGPDGVGKGGGFAFVSLAGVFEHMPGGAFFGFLFYLLLLFAALTSTVSLIEGIVAFLTERKGWRRTPTTIVTCAILFLIGCLYTCSQAAFPLKGVWFDFANGVTFPPLCDAMEFLTDRIMIPLCALGTCFFVGWVWKPESVVAEVERCGVKFRLVRTYSFLIRFVAPAAIVAILLVSLLTGTTLS
ncbi:MAG: sodium-dependent transporter [Oscillospiraceae bacterium]|nr:sodium-dependent transporter [Oscillospiraceae bacterium]